MRTRDATFRVVRSSASTPRCVIGPILVCALACFVCAFPASGALMTCQLSSGTAFASGNVSLDVLIEDVDGVRAYQTTIAITRTSGTGSVTVACPGGVVVDEGRADYIFAGVGVDTYPVVDCAAFEAASAMISGSVNVGVAPAYLSDYTLQVSADAEPGSTFEISVLPFDASALSDESGSPIPFTIGAACGLTIVCETAADCDDGDVCNGLEDCVDDACVSGTQLDCDDTNPCTDDSCDPVSGCDNLNNTAPCDDGDGCTEDDVCAGGACQPGADLDCDDVNPCTDDSCVGGACQNVDNTDGCDDGLFCTLTDTCDTGACVGVGDTCPGQMCDEVGDVCADCLIDDDCDDVNPCTDDSCVGGACQNVDNTDGCDDGLFCTLTDTCDTGACVGVGDTCPGQMCDEVGDVCADCLIDDDCDDVNPCTDDSCVGGACQNVDNTDGCDDGLFCTLTDTCDTGLCVGVGDTCPGQMCDEVGDVCADCLIDDDCDDINPCTDDSCVGGACQNVDNTDGCDDGLFCTLTDTCDTGLCVGVGDTCPGQMCDEVGDVCADCLIDDDCDDINPCTAMTHAWVAPVRTSTTTPTVVTTGSSVR